MAKRKKSIEAMLQELVTDRVEVEIHKQLRKARKALVRQRERSGDEVVEIKALPLPEIIDGDVIEEGQLDLFSKEESQEVEEEVEEDIEQGQD